MKKKLSAYRRAWLKARTSGRDKKGQFYRDKNNNKVYEPANEA